MCLSTVIGATICTPGFETLAHEAARRFRKHTGCDCLILSSDHQRGHAFKLQVPHIAGGRVVAYFDADYWMIRDMSLEGFRNMSGMAAVQDPAALHDETFCAKDALALRVHRSKYWNSGFMVFNSSDPAVLRGFDRASVLLAEKAAGLHPEVMDTTEQSMLVRAMSEQHLPSQFLPQEFNTYLHAAFHGHVDTLPARPYAIHAAGVPLAEKWNHLQRACATFESL